MSYRLDDPLFPSPLQPCRVHPAAVQLSGSGRFCTVRQASSGRWKRRHGWTR